jgi:hypothetical protein
MIAPVDGSGSVPACMYFVASFISRICVIFFMIAGIVSFLF